MCFFSGVGVVVVHGLWSSVMGFLSWFYVEAKIFELPVVEGGQFYVSLKGAEEYSEKCIWASVAWLSTTVDELVHGEESTELIKSSRDGNKALIGLAGIWRWRSMVVVDRDGSL